VLKQVRELALVKALLGEDPLDPPFRCAELRLAYIKVVSVNKVRRADQAHGGPVELHLFPSAAELF
jgi:hypothetical protein